ncbi:MAG: OmpH family outer membrane protein [Candidatus Krumholzibacteriota bacterium]|nr:OmpH family outer membrane protein [Candidatus Krumholzibacteriota bacterium]
MRYKMLSIMLTTAAIVAASAISALAQDIKIGYIDSIRIFAEYKETQEAERLYRQEVDAWTVEKGKMEQDIVRLREELQAQSLMLSEEKKREKAFELEKLMQDYERFMKETFGDNGLAAQRNKELTQPIIDKINKLLEGIAKERQLMMVFDVANADIVYADKSLDLTETVLAKLVQQQ